MDDLCTACLSTGRNLHYIGETGFYELYTQILNDVPAYELSGLCVRVCWECCAVLRRLRTFADTVRRAHGQLLHHLHQTGKPLAADPPRLQVKHVISISCPDWPAVKAELDGELDVHADGELDVHADGELDAYVKSEDDTHCEPETFVHDLSVENVENVGKTRKKAKVKATKGKKKKPKAKSRVKAKRNTPQPSTVLDEAPGLENANDLEDCTEYFDDERTAVNAAVQPEVWACKECGAQFVLQTELDTHMATEHAEEKPGRAKSAAAARRPRAAREALDEKPKCVECGKMFSSRKTYRYHLNVLHKGQNRYPCPRCGKVYQWKSNLGRHLRSHKARDSGELYCELCDKRFASVATFRQHQRVSRRHVAESEFAFICECGKKFVNKTRLRDHIDWEHLNKIKFRCQLCNKPFKCHTSLYVHTQNVHRDKEKKDNLCHVCGKSYQNSAKLKYHIVAMHTLETPYRCAECHAAFGWYSSLYRHVREVHYKMKLQSNKKGKKTKKAAHEVLPSLLPLPQHVLPPILPP